MIYFKATERVQSGSINKQSSKKVFFNAHEIMENVAGDQAPNQDETNEANLTPKSEQAKIEEEKKVNGKAIVSMRPLVQDGPVANELDTTTDDVNIEAHEANVKRLELPSNKPKPHKVINLIVINIKFFIFQK